MPSTKMNTQKTNGWRWPLTIMAALISSCGGGSDGGTFENGGIAPVTVSISADKTILQSNSLNALPDLSGPYTNTITVQVKKDGNPFAAQSVAIDVVSGLSSGALYYLDGNPDHEYCPEPGYDVDKCPVALLPTAYRSLVFGGAETSTSGTVTAHFHASGTPGKVVVRVSTQNPDTSAQVWSELTLTVGPGVSTGQAAVVGLLIAPSPLYITGQGRQDVKPFQAAVLDDANQPVPNPSGNNLRLQLLSNRPYGGEKLVAVSASGNIEEGSMVNTRTINGVAEVALYSGTLPGTIAILATADRADNNVDNGIQTPITDVDTIPIGSGQITSLIFAGAYPNAVQSRANVLALGPGETLDASGGIYVRGISVLAVDEFGNPPPPGQFITFRLIDGPLNGYPDQGRGVFQYTGKDGNPEEGGATFRTPVTGSSLLGADTNCQLVLEGGLGQEGSWIINGQAQAHLLAVFNPFNAVADTGFTVPYTIGCPPYVGNIANNINGVSVYTDEYGMAATIISYPVTQLGRCFKLTAEANGGQVGAVMGKQPSDSEIVGDECASWYLGIADGSALSTIPASDQNLQIPVGQTESFTKTLMLQLLDGDQNAPPAPLPAEKLAVQMVVTDPDKEAVAAAEQVVEAAQAALDTVVASNTASCSATKPENAVSEPEQCASWRTALDAAQQALTDANNELAAAKANDALHTPTASFSPASPLITGVDGLATLTITVAGLYSGARVEFFVSTVGPEVRAPTLTITASPEGSK